MDSETRATDVHYVNVAPYAITKCANHWHVVDGVSGEHIVTQPNELTREQAIDEMDRLNHEAGWPPQPAAAPHAAPREGEPTNTETLRDYAVELYAVNWAGGSCGASVIDDAADEIDSLRARLASQQAALDAAGEDVAAMLRALGLGDHARPASAHAVVQDEILPALAELVRSFLALAAPADAESPAGIIRDRLAARASHPEARDGAPMLDEYQATERLGLRSDAIRAIADAQEAEMRALEDAATRDWSPADTGDEPC